MTSENQWANFNQVWHKPSLGDENSCLSNCEIKEIL